MGKLSNQDFLAMNRKYTQEMDEAQQELDELAPIKESTADFRHKIDSIRKCMEQAWQDASSGVISKNFVDRYY